MGIGSSYRFQVFCIICKNNTETTEDSNLITISIDCSNIVF